MTLGERDEDAALTAVATTAENASVARITSTPGRKLAVRYETALFPSHSAGSETGTATLAERACAQAVRGGRGKRVRRRSRRARHRKSRKNRVTPPRFAQKWETPVRHGGQAGARAPRPLGELHHSENPWYHRAGVTAPIGSCDSRSAGGGHRAAACTPTKKKKPRLFLGRAEKRTSSAKNSRLIAHSCIFTPRNSELNTRVQHHENIGAGSAIGETRDISGGTARAPARSVTG